MPVASSASAMPGATTARLVVLVFAIGAVRAGYGGRLTHAVAEATSAAERAAARCRD